MNSRREVIIRKLLSDPEFRNLFTGIEDGLRSFARDPACPCNKTVVDEVDNRLAGLFGPSMIENEWRVIDCDIEELEAILKRNHRVGRRNFAIAREGNRVVCVLNEIMEVANV